MGTSEIYEYLNWISIPNNQYTEIYGITKYVAYVTQFFLYLKNYFDGFLNVFKCLNLYKKWNGWYLEVLLVIFSDILHFCCKCKFSFFLKICKNSSYKPHQIQKKLSQIISKLNLEYSERIIFVRKNEEMHVCIFLRGSSRMRHWCHVYATLT